MLFILYDVLILRSNRKKTKYQEYLNDGVDYRRNLEILKLQLKNYQTNHSTDFNDQEAGPEVYCLGLGESDKIRTCRFSGLCHVLKSETRRSVYFTYHSFRNQTINWWDIVVNFDPKHHALEMTGVPDHNAFNMRIGDGFELKFLEDQNFYPDLILYDAPTLLSKRFYPINIMHVIHDDLLALFTIRSKWPHLDRQIQVSSYSQENLKFIGNSDFGDPESSTVMNQVHGDDPGGPLKEDLIQNKESHFEKSVENWMMHQFIDISGENIYDEIYSWLPKSILTIGEPNRFDIECWKDVVLGGGSSNAWYQYGFGSTPQGPLTKDWNKKRIFINQLVESITANMCGQTKQSNKYGDQDQKVVVIFSRTRDRLILNEEKLIRRLQTFKNLKVHKISLENSENIASEICILNRATAAFGMHGSLLIMAMFLCPGALLIEGFPLAVPSNHYTPYKNMCNLRGIKYFAWTNKDPVKNKNYPERHASKGGIRHLFEKDRELYDYILDYKNKVKPHFCCSDPHWLHRIYQDTEVDIQWISSTIYRHLLK